MPPGRAPQFVAQFSDDLNPKRVTNCQTPGKALDGHAQEVRQSWRASPLSINWRAW